MSVFREQPYGRSNYLVELGIGDPQSAQAGFFEVILPDARVEAVEYRNGNERAPEPRKLPGCIGYGNLVLKRGLIGSLELYEWWNEVRNGSVATRDVTVQLQSEDRQNVVFTWRFRRAWPVRYGFEPLGTSPCGPAVEVVELTFERMEVE
jgi:phage tail-like protein